MFACVALALSLTLVAIGARPAAAAVQDAPVGLVDGRVNARVDGLVAQGRLQEAAWAAREAGDTARAEVLLARLEAILRAAPLAVAPQSMDSQGVSYTLRLDHGHGVQSIFKVDGSDIFCRPCGAAREVASYRVDRLLGFDLTPMTLAARVVVADGDTLTGSLMYFVRDAALPREVGASKPDLLRLFDAALGNSDRHSGNWLVLPTGKAVAIDHNRTFDYSPRDTPRTCWETEIDSLSLPGALGPVLDRYRDLPDDSLAAAVSALDPDLVQRFLEMRGPVLDRIRRRADDPGATLLPTDCVFDVGRAAVPG